MFAIEEVSIVASQRFENIKFLDVFELKVSFELKYVNKSDGFLPHHTVEIFGDDSSLKIEKTTDSLKLSGGKTAMIVIWHQKPLDYRPQKN